MTAPSESDSGKAVCLGCAQRFDAVQQRLEAQMERWGLNYRQRLLVFHFLDQLKEQILAVLPISLLLVFVIGAFFQQTTNNPGEQAYGLVCAIFGLLFFMEGLRVCVMPLGEMVGSRLPLKYPLPVVLLVAGCLGILVTYAEPAIASLSPLAKLVDKTRAPYLYYALNDQREMLVLSIGLGVGAAAVVGTLRFVKGWSIKPIIYISLVPTIALACYMQWGNPDLAPLLGLAWDCGAVTTGPVTVPILLAMGIGVMSSQRQKRLAQAALHNAVDTNTGQTLEGFGVVTLASVFPVLAVEVMGIMISLTKTKQDIILTAKDTTSNAPVDRSPIREVVFAIRAIMPLITALLLLVLLVIREPLPPLTVFTVPPHVTCPADEPHSAATTPAPAGKRGRRGSPEGGSGQGGKDAFKSGSPGALASTSTSNNPYCSRGVSNLGSGSSSTGLAADSTPPAMAAAVVAQDGGSATAASGHGKGRGGGDGDGYGGDVLTVRVVGDVSGDDGSPARTGSGSGKIPSLPAPPVPEPPATPAAQITAPAAVAEATEGDADPAHLDQRPPPSAMPAVVTAPAAAAAAEGQPQPEGSRSQRNEAEGAGQGEEEEEEVSPSGPRRLGSWGRCPTPHPRKLRLSDCGGGDSNRNQREEDDADKGEDQAARDAAAAVTVIVEQAAEEEEGEAEGRAVEPHPSLLLVREPWYVRYGGLICGIIMAQGGMIMFNIGLTYGFTALGDQAGTLLPAAYLQIPDFPESPYYRYAGGIVLVLVVAFTLGFLATRAEPALRVLGRTVQHLSGGTFTAAMLIYAVSFGVGSGMAVGSTKILFGVPLIYIILIKYAIAVSITVFSEESFTNIAWDSAGVTTGPVTVPFVLSLGIGFSKATRATEGFGILTAASVAPIISVLLTNLLKKPARTVLRQLSRLSSRSMSGAGSISRSSLAALSRRARRHKDTNEAISSVAAIAAAAARLEEQHGGGGGGGGSRAHSGGGGGSSEGLSASSTLAGSLPSLGLPSRDLASPSRGGGPRSPANA